MSLRRLLLTAISMGLVAAALTELTPAAAEMSAALASPQRTVDTLGADALVLAAAGLLAWAVWAWGALGLALTATSALPGALGSAARTATQVLLPAGARRSAALVLGLGLGVAAPLAGVAVTAMAQPAAAAPGAAVPDWPRGPEVPTEPAPAPAPAPEPADPLVPDWPPDLTAAAADGSHVVVRGDCLWHIASARLAAASGTRPTDGEVARAVHAWWVANAEVIGPDPDVLLPGQVLRAPGAS
jgi:nucleoid-associated protein YgaU